MEWWSSNPVNYSVESAHMKETITGKGATYEEKELSG
jgi:hypothetical protein